MTTPLGGLPYPTDPAAAADIITIVSNLAKAADSKLNNRYANAGARNAAFDAWVAAGNTMVDGLQCTVAGIPQIYRSGSWRGTSTSTFWTGTFFPTTIADNTEWGLAELTIPDPGFAYRLEVFALVFVSADASTQPTLRFHLDLVTGPTIGVNIVRPVGLAGESFPLVAPGFETGTLTGTHKVIPTMQRTFGSGSWTVPSVGHYVKAVVRPV